jgi:hypothetical protein
MGRTSISQLGLGIKSEADLDQYLRSVLRPEAFLTPPQPQGLIGDFWNSNIDPNLSAGNSSSLQNPTSYQPWTSAPDFSKHQ